MILLTQNSTFIIGQVAWVLGKIMNGIFIVLNFVGTRMLVCNYFVYDCSKPVDGFR